MRSAHRPVIVGATPRGDALCIEMIRRSLSTRTVGFNIHLHDEVTSTNDVACRLAEQGAREGTTVLAEAQTSGRGRMGRTWFSPRHTNLYASVIFRPAISPSSIPVFAFIAALALADAVSAEGVDASVRWPNDVVATGRRLGGTLARTAGALDAVQHAVLGIGVNLNVPREALVAALGEAATMSTSVSEVAGRQIDRNRFTASLLNRLERWHALYRSRGPDAILQAWNERDAVRGRLVEIREPGGTYRRGRVVGVERDGRLVLDPGSGGAETAASGDLVTIDGTRAR